MDIVVWIYTKNSNDNFGDLIEWIPKNIQHSHYHLCNPCKVTPFDGLNYDKLELYLKLHEDLNLLRLIFGHKYDFEIIDSLREI